MANCPPEYTNLGEESFGDQKYVTSTMLQSFCRSLAWLKEKTEEVEDSSDPEMRKWIIPMVVDEENSYGMKEDSGENRWIFDDGVYINKPYSLTSFDDVDIRNTTARLDVVGGKATLQPTLGESGFTLAGTYRYTKPYSAEVVGVVEQDTGTTYKKVTSSALVESTASSWYWDGTTLHVRTSSGSPNPPTHRVRVEWVNTKCEGPWGAYRANAAWYVGYKRDVPYWATPEWMADSFSADMESVIRAQTFTSTGNGLLAKVTLNLHGNVQAEDKLYLEIRTTSNGAPTSTVLARVEVDMTKFQSGGLVAIPMPYPVKLVSGTKYAWVLRSPFTSYNHHFGVGGWGKNCNADPYTTGDAFTSYDNGQTWMQHGRAEALPYHEGMYAPQDFAFHITCYTDNASYPAATSQYLYMKPVRSGPVTSYALTTHSHTTGTGGTVTYHVTGDWDNWYELNSGNNYTKTWSSGYPTWTVLRVTLADDDGTTTPELTGVGAYIDTNESLDGYLRTAFYNPRLTNPLGASLWSRIHAPTTASTGTTVSIDIIKGTPKTDHFTATDNQTVFILSEYPARPLINIQFSKAGGGYTHLEETKDYTVNYGTKTVTLDTGVSIASVVEIEYYPLWIKGLDATDFPKTDPYGFKTDLFTETFTGDGTEDQYTLLSIPLDPIRKVTWTTGETETEKIEGIDFTVDYMNKMIDFTTNVPSGTVVEVKYTPNLADTSLAIAYTLTRTDNAKYVYVEPYFFQTRT